MVFWGSVVYSVTIRKRKDGFIKMKNKLTALLAALLLSISLLHTEVYASLNPYSEKPSEVLKKVKLENEIISGELELWDCYGFRNGTLIHPFQNRAVGMIRRKSSY